MKRFAKIMVVVAVTVGLVVFFSADPATIRYDSAVPVSDARFLGYVSAVTASPATKGDQYDVLVNGDQVYPAMLEAIRSAQKRINMLTYAYDPGATADTFTSALVEARARGVDNHVDLDAVGGSSISEKDVDTLEKAGATIKMFRPLEWNAIQESSYRNHRKILVVDGEVGFTGGFSVADHWTGNAEGPQHWRDSHFRIRGPVVRYLEAVFYESLAETIDRVTLNVGPSEDGRPSPPDGSASSVIVSSAPDGGSGGVKRLFLLSIVSAQQSIDITSPYFIVDESTQWALEEARRRGVRVRVLVEGDRTDAKPVKWAGRSQYERLLSRGIEIYEYQPTMMHAKTMTVDGVWSIIGSANFDNRSLDMNDEVNIGIADPALASQLRQVFENDLLRCTQLTLDAWRQRSWTEQANEKVWSLLNEVF
jgi:cardiolipin synthase A/B